LTRWPNKLLNAGMRLAAAPAVDRLAGGNADLLWVPNLNFLAASPGLPLALTVHDLSFERYPEFFSTRRRLWHGAVGPRDLCLRAAAVLAVSEHTKRDLVELYGLPPERIAVTHEGCDPSFFEAPDASALAEAATRLRLPERFILHVGALEPRKNHQALLDAFHQLKPQSSFADLGLVLAGPKGWQNGPIRHAIARSPYRESIRLLGFVGTEDRRALYRLASVFAFPSFYEGFGLPPLEAMASGAPTVASFASSLGEVVGDAGILIDPYRPSELADAMAAALESGTLAEELSERGRARAAMFSWEACAKKTAAAFERAAR
jgi:glycosyltransferase involved in cell wall biosynthesis